MAVAERLPGYDRLRSYEWNYERAPAPVRLDVPEFPGEWQFCGLPVASPLGVPAGPLLNGKWCLYYASLGFDVVTYKTVRSGPRPCYQLPNLQPVDCDRLEGGETGVNATGQMQGSWAVSFGMPSKSPEVWRADIEWTRRQLAKDKLLSVSVVGTVQPDWSLDDLAGDYARCAQWAVESGADCVETNFSCPNVSTCDGQIYQNADQAGLVAERVREAIGRVPLIVKIGHLSDLETARQLLAAVDPWVDAIAMTNSIATTVRQPSGGLLFGGEKRGICGAATLDASVAQTAMAREIVEQQELSLQLIGVGGAATAADVKRYLDAGAVAVHIATAAMVDPATALQIRRQWRATT